MKPFQCFTVVFALALAQSVSADVQRLAVRQESGELENLKFAYDGHTQMLMMLRQAVCYIFVLTDEEKNMVHTNTGLRNLELKVLGQVSQPNLPLTTVPRAVLNTNILKECGKNVINYHIVQ